VGWTSKELYGSQQAERLSLRHSVQTHPGGDSGFCSLPGILSAGWSGWSEKLIAYFYPVLRLRMSGALPSLPTCLHGVDRDSFKFTSHFSLSVVLLGLSFSCIFFFYSSFDVLTPVWAVGQPTLGRSVYLCISRYISEAFTFMFIEDSCLLGRSVSK
jgi:hypothetical protein